MQNRLQPCVFYYKQPIKKARLAHMILLYLYLLDQALFSRHIDEQCLKKNANNPAQNGFLLPNTQWIQREPIHDEFRHNRKDPLGKSGSSMQ